MCADGMPIGERADFRERVEKGGVTFPSRAGLKNPKVESLLHSSHVRPGELRRPEFDRPTHQRRAGIKFRGRPLVERCVVSSNESNFIQFINSSLTVDRLSQ